MIAAETDPTLRRIVRRAVVVCAVFAAAALALDPARPEAAVGVLGGGILAALSYWAIRASVDGLLAFMGSGQAAVAGRPRPWRILLVLTGRYALLGFGAYVMIVRLRLHPLGLIAGASSLVASTTVEALRWLRPGSSPPGGRGPAGRGPHVTSA